MQDNNVAIVVGEDGTTGGGGAIVTKQLDFSFFLPNQFDLLPYSEYFTDISLGWAMGTRPSGEIIEDYGVESERIIRPSIEDIIHPENGTRQLDEIAKILSLKAKSNKALCKLLFNDIASEV
jgi:C-terminal processing protease CtpA/Prc